MLTVVAVGSILLSLRGWRMHLLAVPLWIAILWWVHFMWFA